MTQKERIKEIAQSFRTARMFSKHPCEIAEDAAQQMADWKDIQFAEEKKQWIDKAAKWLEDNQRAYKEYDESGFYHERSQNLIKDFKKAIEE